MNFPIASAAEISKLPLSMNCRAYLLLPTLGLLASCDTINEPIYYDTAGNPVQAPVSAQGPIAPVQQTTANAPVQSAPTYSPAQPTRRAQSNSPFMQPDVLGLPSKDDLKETSGSGLGGNRSSGLTVPSQ